MSLLSWFATLLFVLLCAEPAYAWGPGAHIDYALYALSHASLALPALRKLLQRYPQDYLYGNIAADITLGKKFAGELYHCHNWSVAMSLFEKAPNDRARAFMLGYMSHLSVDIIAHNYFVPFKTIRSYNTLTLKHTYWEIRYDDHMPDKVWKVLSEIASEDFSDHDIFLESSLKRALFSFKTNKKIFNSLIVLQRMQRWRQASRILSLSSSYDLTAANVKHYKQLCYASILDFIKRFDQARCTQVDPSGKLKLLYAKNTAAQLKRLHKEAKLNLEDDQKLLLTIKSELHDSIYQSERLTDLSDYYSS